MKLNKAQVLLSTMIEADLQQGWACLELSKWDLAKSHFTEATRKIDEMAAAAAAETKPAKAGKQISLDV